MLAKLPQNTAADNLRPLRLCVGNNEEELVVAIRAYIGEQYVGVRPQALLQNRASQIPNSSRHIRRAVAGVDLHRNHRNGLTGLFLMPQDRPNQARQGENGQGEEKPAAYLRLALNPDLPALPGHQILGNMQAEP